MIPMVDPTSPSDALTQGLTNSGYTVGAILAVAVTGIGLGVAQFGPKRLWAFFKGIAK